MWKIKIEKSNTLRHTRNLRKSYVFDIGWTGD